LNQTGIQWISVDITAQVNQVRIFFDQERLERPFKQGACSVTGLIVCFRVAVEYRLDELADRVIAFLPEEEMVMVWHQAIRDDRDPALQSMFFYSVKEK
jgi:hypothetical protein